MSDADLEHQIIRLVEICNDIRLLSNNGNDPNNFPFNCVDRQSSILSVADRHLLPYPIISSVQSDS